MKSPSFRRLERLVVAAAAFGVIACTTVAPRGPQQMAIDDALATRVEQALVHDPRIYARHIDVEAEAGVVRLSGFVFASEDLWEARRVSEQVPGVISVRSNIELEVGGRGASR